MTKFMQLPEVEEKIGFKKSFIFEAVRKGKFPEPIRFGYRKTLWVEEEINAWMRDQIDQRNKGEAVTN